MHRLIGPQAHLTFTTNTVRRTAEPLRASRGEDNDMWARLLSHGHAHGVQAQHDGRDRYLPQERQAGRVEILPEGGNRRAHRHASRHARTARIG